VLDEYSTTHGIPPRLKADMKGHLRLHFSTSDYRDDAVLGVFPTTIRRRTLRHLYNAPLHSCWLFGGAKQKFLDALLLGARVELFGPKVGGGAEGGLRMGWVSAGCVWEDLVLCCVGDVLCRKQQQLCLAELPHDGAALLEACCLFTLLLLQVDIVSAGDFVNELHLILAGHAAAERGNAGDTQLASDGATSIHGASLRLLGPGEPAGEMAFFTETPSMEVGGGGGGVLGDKLAGGAELSSAVLLQQQPYSILVCCLVMCNRVAGRCNICDL
jgi:hypothetical protein